MVPQRVSPLALLLGAIFCLATHVLAGAAVLGIDLGTEYIKTTLVKPGIPLDIVLTKDSRRKETAAVAFKPPKGGVKPGDYPERAYGADAIALAPRFPGDVYPNLKSLLGLQVDNLAVQEYAARHPGLQLQPHPDRNTASFKSKSLADDVDAWMVEELLAMELSSIRKDAEVAAGSDTSVRSVILTIPPFYSTEEKRAVKLAADLAGLKVVSLITDGLAVGLNYATSRQFPNIDEGAKPEYHMVFDMGAGSTKATVMKFQSRNVKDVGKFNKTIQEVQVVGTGWDRNLGGDALNNLIIDDMVNQFVESSGAKQVSATVEGVKAHGRAIAKLTKEAERVRHVLSANQNTGASFEGLYEDVDFKYKITRADFETMASTHAERLAVAINGALRMSGLDFVDLTSVILHGGASRTPFVQKLLENIVGSPDKLRSNVNADEAAAFGAGFRAAELSPSFRVKEIRISEGPVHPIYMSWPTAEGKSHRQRLFTPISPIGGDAKEVSFNKHDDSTFNFQQQVDSVDQVVRTVSTKNLTATFAEMKQKYPSCAEDEIYFRVGAKLALEDGEVQIVKAAVECEAEVKEGFVDGVKNLFGLGKKDQEPSREGEPPIDADAEGSKEELKDDAKAGDSSAAEESNDDQSGSDDASAKEAETEVKSPKKRELVSIPIEIEVTPGEYPVLSADAITQTKTRLKAFAASNRARVLREEALNQLEAYLYRVRDLLDSDSFVARSTEQERSHLAEKADVISEWLDQEGSDATRDVLKAKLKEFEDAAAPITKRREEAERRPEMITALKSSLNQTNYFLGSMRQQIEAYEEWYASDAAVKARAAEEAAAKEDGEASEDKPATDGMEDLFEEDAPVPPIYKREDLEEVEALYQSTLTWLKDATARQDALPENADPVLLTSDLKSKREKLDKANMDLAMKGVKSFDSKAKKAKKHADKKKKKKSTSSTSSEPHVETPVSEDGKDKKHDEL